MNRIEIAALIAGRLKDSANQARREYEETRSGIGYFVVDDLLPAELAHEIAAAFPAKEAMTAKRSLRERKAIMARMADCAPLVGEAIYAFHDPEVLALVGQITGVSTIEADPFLYAGGISAMGAGDFLNPHLDNSHDKDRARWRAFNLLYYVSPEWPEDKGGNLELWPSGVGGDQITIHSRFNRLAVMVTHGKAWHSVSPIATDQVRMCVSNYYFTPEPMAVDDQFHVTTFRGRPEQRIADAVLRADAIARGALRKLKPSGVGRLTHLNEPAN
jgi:Rps23 Pro-64 3,4-dihydroxylase Tpa1-like proline 4-hydroxylase